MSHRMFKTLFLSGACASTLVGAAHAQGPRLDPPSSSNRYEYVSPTQAPFSVVPRTIDRIDQPSAPPTIAMPRRPSTGEYYNPDEMAPAPGAGNYYGPVYEPSPVVVQPTPSPSFGVTIEGGGALVPLLQSLLQKKLYEKIEKERKKELEKHAQEHAHEHSEPAHDHDHDHDAHGHDDGRGMPYAGPYDGSYRYGDAPFPTGRGRYDDYRHDYRGTGYRGGYDARDRRYGDYDPYEYEHAPYRREYRRDFDRRDDHGHEGHGHAGHGHEMIPQAPLRRDARREAVGVPPQHMHDHDHEGHAHEREQQQRAQAQAQQRAQELARQQQKQAEEQRKRAEEAAKKQREELEKAAKRAERELRRKLRKQDDDD